MNLFEYKPLNLSESAQNRLLAAFCFLVAFILAMVCLSDTLANELFEGFVMFIGTICCVITGVHYACDAHKTRQRHIDFGKIEQWHDSSTAEYREVTIPATEEHQGRVAVTLRLKWVCPDCGQPRGKPYKCFSWDGSHNLWVDGWKNACGHVDTYADCRKEANPAPAGHSSDMITNSKQNWQVGKTVKIGFMTLKVTGVRAVRDGLPDIYSLVSLDGTKEYEFTPHNGLVRIN